LKKQIISILFTLCIVGSVMPPAGASEAGGDEAMAISEAGIRFIEKFEGFSSYEYSDSSQWYIGYGTGCNKGDYPDGVSKEEAEELLRKALREIEDSVGDFIDENRIELTQHQFDALVSFTYNLGTSWMNSSNRLRSCLIDGAGNDTDIEIVNAIGIWCHSGGTINDLLIERRLAEAMLFLYDDYESGGAQNYSYLYFDAGDGHIEYDIVFYERGKPYGTLPEAERAGYAFAGWRLDGGEQIGPAGTAAENRTVFASWDGETETVAQSPYPDVSGKDWFYSYVTELSNSGVFSGYPDGTFQASRAVNCGEALKLILRAAGFGEQKAAGSHWASGYQSLAVSKGLVVLKDIPDLNASISRRLIAQIAAKALRLTEASIATPFSDTSDGYVLSLFEAGIIEGSRDDSGNLKYKPESSITRAELSAIVWRINNTGIEIEEKPQIQYGSYSVDVLESVPVASYDTGRFYTEGGLMRYDSSEVETRAGIDVSEYQGKIDWEKVKASGIEFAIIRLGYRGYTEGGIYPDSCFDSNIKGALDAGLEVGVYFFSQAITVEEALEEAEFVLTRLEGYHITYPVVFDWEVIGKSSARTYGLDTDTLSQCAVAFCDKMADAGYAPMIYFTSYAGYVKYDLSRLKGYEFWFAQYSATPSFYYDYQMWQYTSSGKVDGISGNVDMNIYFSGKKSLV